MKKNHVLRPLAALLAGLYLTACGPIAPTEADETAELGQVSSRAICETCDPPPPDDEEEDPPPPPPNPCGSTSYHVSPTATPWPTDWPWVHQASHDYAKRAGYEAAFRNHHQASYDGIIVNGTFLVKYGYASFRDVPLSELGNMSMENVPGMFRAAHSYANRNGFVGALPTFHMANVNGVEVRGVHLWGSNAVEFREVPACEFGFPNVADVGQMFRAANDYIVRNGLPPAFPTFTSRTTSDRGTLYGLMVFKPGLVDWRDVRRQDFELHCGGENQTACYGNSYVGCDSDTPHHFMDINWDKYQSSCHALQCGVEGGRCCFNGLTTSCGSGLSCNSSGFCVQPQPPPPPPPPSCGGLGEACCTTGSACDTSELGCITNTCRYTSGSETIRMDSTSCGQYSATDIGNPTKVALESVDMLITTIKNTSSYPARFTHVDKNNRSAVVLIDPGQTYDLTSENLTYRGSWSATISTSCEQAPLSVSLTVDWRRP